MSTHPHPPYGWAVVRGDSMRPSLAPGDRLLVRYGTAIRPGALVLARFPDGALVIKRATDERETRDGRPAWWLSSDDPGVGVDSRHRGPVAADQVLGVALLRVWPRPRLLGGIPPRSGWPRCGIIDRRGR